MSVDPVNISKPNSVVEFFFVTLVILDGRIEAVTRDHRVYVESNSILGEGYLDFLSTYPLVANTINTIRLDRTEEFSLSTRKICMRNIHRTEERKVVILFFLLAILLIWFPGLVFYV
jgi:hypothetical protein